MADDQVNTASNPLDIAREITVAWLGNPNVNAAANDVPAFLMAIHATISELSNGPVVEAAAVSVEFVPAVAVRSSVKPDHIVSLINGQKFKTLKRHLSLHGLTPKEYRERYGLKADYPMVAASYSEHRREVARKLGLGRKPAPLAAEVLPEATAVDVEPAPAKPKPKRGPAKARIAKAGAPVAKASSEPVVLEQAPATPPVVSETFSTEAVPTRTKAKRFARSNAAQPVAHADEAITILPKPKKPLTAPKLKAVPNADVDAEPIAASPKRGRAKKPAADA